MQRPHQYKRSFYDYFREAAPQQIREDYAANKLYLSLLKLIKTFLGSNMSSSHRQQLAEKVIQVISLFKPEDSPPLQLLIGVVHEKMGAPTKALEHYCSLFARLPAFYSAYTYYCTLQFQRIAALTALPTLTRQDKTELKDLYTSVKWVLEEMNQVWQTAQNGPKAVDELPKSAWSKRRKVAAEKERIAEANQFYAQALDGLSQLQALNYREVNVPNNAFSSILLFARKKEQEKSKVCAPRPL